MSGDKLVVKAENGDEIEYNIIFEQKELALKFKDNAFNLVLGQGIFGSRISSGKKDLDTNLTVEEFWNALKIKILLKVLKFIVVLRTNQKLATKSLRMEIIFLP